MRLALNLLFAAACALGLSRSVAHGASGRTVSTIAALRELVPDADGVHVAGYRAPGDFGESETFRWTASSIEPDDGCTIIAPDGGRKGRWLLDRPSPLNIKACGARGDGSDDTVALAAAIALQVPLHCPAGTFVVSSITLAPGSTFDMTGNGDGSCILRHAKNATLSMLRSEISPAPVARFSVKGVSFDGNHVVSRKIAPIEIKADRYAITGNEFYRTVNAAIIIQTTTIEGDIEHNRFHDMAVHDGVSGHDTSTVLILQRGPRNGPVRLVGNEVINPAPSKPGNSTGGFVVIGLPGHQQTVTIAGNTFDHIGQSVAGNIEGSIYLYQNADGSRVEGNRILHAVSYPISVQRSSNVTIRNNVVDGEDAHPSPARDPVIRVGGRDPAIPLSHVEISGNVAKGLVHFGPCIDVEGDASALLSEVSLTDNVCEGMASGYFLRYAAGNIDLSRSTFRNLNGTVAIGFGVEIRDALAPATITCNAMTFENLANNAIFIDDRTPRPMSVSCADGTVMNAGANGRAITVNNVERFTLNRMHFSGTPSGAIEARANRHYEESDNIAPAGAVRLYGALTSVVSHGNSWNN